MQTTDLIYRIRLVWVLLGKGKTIFKKQATHFLAVMIFVPIFTVKLFSIHPKLEKWKTNKHFMRKLNY